MAAGRKFRMYPSKGASALFARWIGAQAFIWNAKLNERRMWLSLSRLDARQYPDHREWPEQDAGYAWAAGSPGTAWLDEIPGQIKRNAAASFATAVNRHLKGLGGEPKPKTQSSKRSAWITRELFEFLPWGEGKALLRLGTHANLLHYIPVNVTKDFVAPASIHVWVDGNAWFASGDVADEAFAETREETAARLAMMGEAELAERSWGGDRGVAIPMAGSDGLAVDFSPIQKQRMADKERKSRKWQRKLARQQRQYAQQKAQSTQAGIPLPKTSGKQRKAIARLRKQKRYAPNVRDDVAHKATTALANDGRYVAYAMEKLAVKNMTKAPKAKEDPHKPGRHLPNMACAKAGLNKAILASMWGRFAALLEYKARERRKLFLRVDPKHTSQECSQCGHIHPGNRLSQAVFACSACGHSENADMNAAKVIKARMVAQVIAGAVAPKPKAKKVSVRKGKSAATESRGGSEPRPAEGQSEATQARRFHASKKRESSSFMTG